MRAEKVSGQRSDDEAGVGFAGQVFGLRDHPALPRPACQGGIGELGEPAGGPSPSVGFGLRVGQLPADPLDEPGVAGQADDVVHPVVLAPGQQLLAGIGGIDTKEDLESGPLPAEPGDDAAERSGDPSGGVGVARPEQGEERASAAGDVQRQEAVVAVVAVIGPALLAAMHLIVRRVDVEHEA